MEIIAEKNFLDAYFRDTNLTIKEYVTMADNIYLMESVPFEK